ncbi:HORMA domain-containing protein [Crucibulum laeve]|uniref:HORMA domain-containing protein n=1 Tax=Crucibulum laeve TaxID=68775 RepID=A0A5C3MAE3_9AGAR|nr:HORMA domain-containing protein [Crucibulum laeve]
MQAQKARTEVQSISSTQSLASVHTLLKAGLGCITYLRNLLPEDNFSESHLTTADESLPYDSLDASSFSMSSPSRRKVNGFKVMTMTRGYTDEADKILNYLEYGIFDALEKRYLRSFIFAIYLESKDPSNIVEAYTFNFQYHTFPGTNTVMPIMSLGAGLRNMSLTENRDPVAEAVKKGRPPTLKEVKKSVKALLKTLIHVISQMDALPKRRYATFKVFYTDETPDDYEPPQFQAGDAEKDKWFFMTHDLDEVPDKWNIGKLRTGHHSVNLSVTSIATYLPSSTEFENAAFAGTTTLPVVHPSFTPVQEAVIRAQQAEKQHRDAEQRNVVWSAEDDLQLGDEDAEGEDDPDYIKQLDGRYEKINFRDSGVDFTIPVGLRNQNGEIKPLSCSGEAYFAGEFEDVPTLLKEIAEKTIDIHGGIEETQSMVDETQDMCLSSPQKNMPTSTLVGADSLTRRAVFDSSLPPSDIGSSLTSPIPSINMQEDEMAIESRAGTNDAEMLDMETQVETNPNPESIDPIRSFGPGEPSDTIEEGAMTPWPRTRGATSSVQDVITDNGLDCECGISIEDACCFCEAGCRRWYHVWCMGYHSVDDKRLPTKFTCFDCRVRADLSWELIKVDLYPKMLSKFKELALFRRVIKVVEAKKSATPAEFAKGLGEFDPIYAPSGDHALARQLLKRLETEEFVAKQTTAVDDLGFTETTTKYKGKDKKKQTRRKNVQKTRYVFNRAIKSTSKYSDYFNPDQDVENRMIGLSMADFKSREKKTTRRAQVEEENEDPAMDMSPPHALAPNGYYDELSQTQEETQAPASGGNPLLRSSLKRAGTMLREEHAPRPKKVKISVTTGLDLAE